MPSIRPKVVLLLTTALILIILITCSSSERILRGDSKNWDNQSQSSESSFYNYVELLWSYIVTFVSHFDDVLSNPFRLITLLISFFFWPFAVIFHFVGHHLFSLNDSEHPFQQNLKEYMLTNHNISELVAYYLNGRGSEL